MADIVFNCVFCNESLIVDERGIGLEVPCPHCLHKIAIPEDAEPVNDPDSIIEVDAPAHHPVKDPPSVEFVAKGSTVLDDSDHQARDGDDGTPDCKTDPLSEDSAETILSLLESLLDDQPDIGLGSCSASVEADRAVSGERGGEEPPGATVTGDGLDEPGAEAVSLDKKLMSVAAELKGRLDKMSQAYQESGMRVSQLKAENQMLQARIAAGESEREGISARLDNFSESVHLGEILDEVEGGGAHKKFLAHRPAVVAGRFSIPYPYVAALILLSTVLLMIGLHKSIDQPPKQHAEMVLPAPVSLSPIKYREILLRENAMFPPIELKVLEVSFTAGSMLPEAAEYAGLNSEETFLTLRVTLENKAAVRPVYLGYLWEDAQLEDNEGRIVSPRLDHVANALNQNRETADELMPNQVAESLLVFDAPSRSARNFALVCRPRFWLQNKEGMREKLPIDGLRLTFNRNEISPLDGSGSTPAD